MVRLPPELREGCTVLEGVLSRDFVEQPDGTYEVVRMVRCLRCGRPDHVHPQMLREFYSPAGPFMVRPPEIVDR